MNDRRKFRSQTSGLWTDAATGVGRVREERVSRKKIKVSDKIISYIYVSPMAFPLQKGRTRVRYKMVWGEVFVAEIGLGPPFL